MDWYIEPEPKTQPIEKYSDLTGADRNDLIEIVLQQLAADTGADEDELGKQSQTWHAGVINFWLSVWWEQNSEMHPCRGKDNETIWP